MKLHPVLVACCLFSSHFAAQRPALINGEAFHFQVKNGNDPVDFIVIDTALQTRKPVFLFCQGSLPIPLFVRSVKYGTFMIGGGVTNFDLNDIRKHYHFVVISMPETPVMADDYQLSPSYVFVPDTAQPNQLSEAFLRADELENYRRRADKVLAFLRKQRWVDPSKLVLAGHSQGSKVAAAIARNNKRVTCLGLFAANPFGRIDQFVRQSRKEAERKNIDWAEADRQTENWYQMYRDAQTSTEPGMLAWKTFSRPFIDDWLKLDIPVYLAYGSDDITSDLCDIVPLLFISHGKTNLTYKRYGGLEHNFFETGPDGRAQYDKAHWKEVMNAFVRWTVDH